MDHESVLNKIREVAKTTIPKGGSVVLYGSRARGEAHADSDWDLLILVDKNKIEKSDYDDVVYPFTSLGWDIGEMIIPVIYTKHEWESTSYSPFYKNVERDKVAIV